ncbi:hypothetical protein [Burkholderia ubonensis]|uniref:hypothetical protein n=1 Tax=Burkholderia ubonensis TaxID=101571 RepID=UPI001E435C51|nr:hypothetical protein [Burkholderia ubonensis]
MRKLQIERALPFDLWASTRANLAAWSDGSGPAAPRWRTARALLLLMGDAGLRIAEAVTRGRARRRGATGFAPDRVAGNSRAPRRCARSSSMRTMPAMA